MVFTQVITVLSAQKYDFKDDNGKQMDGCKVTYITDWASVEKQNSKGVEILTSTIPLERYGSLMALPASYNAEFAMRKGVKGVPMLTIEKLDYIEPFKAFIEPYKEKDGK